MPLREGVRLWVPLGEREKEGEEEGLLVGHWEALGEIEGVSDALMLWLAVKATVSEEQGDEVPLTVEETEKLLLLVL